MVYLDFASDRNCEFACMSAHLLNEYPYATVSEYPFDPMTLLKNETQTLSTCVSAQTCLLCEVKENRMGADVNDHLAV